MLQWSFTRNFFIKSPALLQERLLGTPTLTTSSLTLLLLLTTMSSMPFLSISLPKNWMWLRRKTCPSGLCHFHSFVFLNLEISSLSKICWVLYDSNLHRCIFCLPISQSVEIWQFLFIWILILFLATFFVFNFMNMWSWLYFLIYTPNPV